MKCSVTTLRALISLINGESVADSKLRGELFDRLKEEKMLVVMTKGSRKVWRAHDVDLLRFHLSDAYGLHDPEQCLRMAGAENASRAEQVQTVGDSKFRTTRSFKGFLVNSLTPIETSLNGRPFPITPHEGSFLFIYDFESFLIPEDTIVIGIENPENFRWISRQEDFFRQNVAVSSPLLFVSRYPQNQHGDMVRWLKSIPNRYVHFGDLDLAGIKIFLTEYFSHLGSRSSFLVPDDYDSRLASGSPDRYTDQLQFASIVDSVIADSVNTDNRLRQLVEAIHRHHRGYDQEGFIDMNAPVKL